MDALTLEARAQLAGLRRQIEGNRKSIDAVLKTLDMLIDAPEGRVWLARILELRARYVTSSAKVLERMEAGREGEAVHLVDAEILPALDALQASIKGLLVLQNKAVPVGCDKVRQQLGSALALMTVLDGTPAALWKSEFGDL